MVTGRSYAGRHMNVGLLIRGRRQRQGLSLRELARRTGLSVSFLSQVERDLAAPSLGSLKQIATALGVKVSELVTEPETDRRMVLRRADRPVLQLARVRFELLAEREGRLMEPQLVTYEPGADAGEHPVTHEGEEFCLILSGVAEWQVGDNVVVLEAGDSLYFEAGLPHRMRNPGDQPCVCLVVVSPASF